MSNLAFASLSFSHGSAVPLLHISRNLGISRIAHPRGLNPRTSLTSLLPIQRLNAECNLNSNNFPHPDSTVVSTGQSTQSEPEHRLDKSEKRVETEPSFSAVNPPNFRPTGIINPFNEFVNSIDRYKEATRLHRRTIFTDDDWIRFRSSNRIFENLSTTFTSILINGLWLEIGAVTLTAFVVYILNAMIMDGLFAPLLPPGDDSVALSLPALPFQLSSPALGLLLVFRTNTVYMRWNTARMAWDTIQNHCNNLARQGMAYLKVPSEKEELVRRIIALAYVLKRHFRTDAKHEDAILHAKLEALLGAAEAARLLSADVCPTQAMTDISRVIRRTPNLDGSTRSRFDQQVDELNRAYLTCEGLRRTPVPLVYTRHTERFLGLWTLLLPLALTRELGGSVAVVPMSAMVGLFLFGIEEIGVQIEEPFTIMPLEDAVARMEREVRQMLRHEVAFADADPPLGDDVAEI